jgi:hypothetical protein
MTCCEGKTGVVIREWFLASWSGIFIWRKVVLKGRKDRRSRGTEGWRKSQSELQIWHWMIFTKRIGFKYLIQRSPYSSMSTLPRYFLLPSTWEICSLLHCRVTSPEVPSCPTLCPTLWTFQRQEPSMWRPSSIWKNVKSSRKLMDYKGLFCMQTTARTFCLE